MTQGQVERSSSERSLVWLVLIAVALMGLTITRQQALGSLHQHTDQGLRGNSELLAAASDLAHDWLSRWHQQQNFGHGQLLQHTTKKTVLWPPCCFRISEPTGARGDHDHDHDHDALERHHHAVGVASVVAVDVAAEAGTDAATGAPAGLHIVLPGVITPSAGLVLPTLAARQGRWPVDSAVAFVSWNVAPPLRPPTA